MDNIEITKARKQNMRIYPLYRAISLDLIFYYSIEFLFLTQVKHISSSDVVLSTSMYAIFMIIFQIPASMIIDKLGTRKCTILANIFNATFVILIMFCKNLSTLIFAQFISALCFSLKDISDVALIKYSIPKTKKSGEIFSKLEGKGLKNYFVFNAITSVLSGFLYVFNPYIPLIISLIITILSTIMSFGFKDIKEEKEKNVNKESTKTYIQDLIKSIKLIVNSQRLRSLFLYSGISWGIFTLMGTYRASLLVDIGTPEQIITIVAAITGIASSIGAKKQLEFHNKFRNKSLATILVIITISIFVAGTIVIINTPYKLSLIIITICFAIITFVKGVSGVITKRYLGNFADEKVLTQIYAMNAISRNIFRAIISFIGSYLLRITNTANSMIIIGIILIITVLGLISYMKPRLGLKPEEYSEAEIPRI